MARSINRRSHENVKSLPWSNHRMFPSLTDFWKVLRCSLTWCPLPKVQKSCLEFTLNLVNAVKRGEIGRIFNISIKMNHIYCMLNVCYGHYCRPPLSTLWFKLLSNIVSNNNNLLHLWNDSSFGLTTSSSWRGQGKEKHVSSSPLITCLLLLLWSSHKP